MRSQSHADIPVGVGSLCRADHGVRGHDRNRRSAHVHHVCHRRHGAVFVIVVSELHCERRIDLIALSGIDDSGVSHKRAFFIVADGKFAGICDLAFPPGNKKVEITGIPLRIEIEILGIAGACAALKSAAESRGPVVAISCARAEEVRAVIVFPCLEVGAETPVVFRVDLIDHIFHADFGMRDIVKFQHVFDILAGIERGVEEETVQPLVNCDLVLASDQFHRIVGHVRTDVFDHRIEFARRTVCGEIDEFRLAGRVSHAGLVEMGDDGVDSHAVGAVLETVFFCGNDDRADAVRKFDALYSGGNRNSVFRAIDVVVVVRLIHRRLCSSHAKPAPFRAGRGESHRRRHVSGDKSL